jgi:PAS domain S-box-containing protein
VTSDPNDRDSTDTPFVNLSDTAVTCSAALRQRAEEHLRSLESAVPPGLTPLDLDRLIHDLRVYQIELEIQNEELRRAQEIARERYFDLYDLAPAGYVTLTDRGLIREANLAAATLLGLPRGTLINRPLSAFILPEDQDSFYHCRHHLLETGERQTCELRLRQPDGADCWVRLALSTGADQEHQSKQCLIILSDISLAKAAESQIIEEGERIDRFLAMLGHELRNPLAAIRYIAEGLRLAPTGDPARLGRSAEVLNRQVTHLTSLVDDLLDVARIGRGTMQFVKRSCDLRTVMEEAAEQAQLFLEDRGQRLDLKLPDTAVQLDGDPVRLAQMLVNLLRNASQFSPAASPVSLTLGVDQGTAVIQVHGQGEGLDPRRLPRLFEPFARAERAENGGHDGGLWMGLPLAKGVAELHGGSIAATSPGLGQGSTFSVRLPLADAPDTTAPPQAPPQHQAIRRVLVVEDNPDVAAACTLLLRLLGHRVEAVQDGMAALEAAERLRPDLILLDIGLPGIDGVEVGRRLRATAAGRAARLVAVTGYGQPEDMERTRAAGFDEHLLKPLGEVALVGALARCPRQSRAVE